MTSHILLMDGPDGKGLIYLVCKTLYENACNIIKQDEFVSTDGQFFMRTEFEGEVEIDVLLSNLYKALPDGINLRLNPKKKKDIIVFCTKEHHCLAELLIRYAFNELEANILAVISNHNILQPFVSKFGIPFHYISHEHKTREEHEAAILRTIDIYKPEYLVLAKYMRVISADFVNLFPNRIINIHHSFLPAFVGASPYKQAYERGVKIIGATAHFVNNNLDEGPIISQNIKEVDHRYSAQDMATEGKDIEKIVFSQALKLVFNDKVFIHGNRTVIL